MNQKISLIFTTHNKNRHLFKILFQQLKRKKKLITILKEKLCNPSYTELCC